MAKIKLKITHIIDKKETISYVIGIKEDNKIRYLDDGYLVGLEIIGNDLFIKRSKDYENNMYFGSNSYGYFVIDGKKIDYEIKTNKIKITKNKIELEYVIDSINKYILEDLDG